MVCPIHRCEVPDGKECQWCKIAVPSKPYTLSEFDRKLLKNIRIATQ